MFNRITVIGRTTDQPTLVYTKNGKALSRVAVAVERKYKNSEGKKVTDFIPVVMWGKLAETVAEYLRKGKLIAVDGSLEVRNYEQDGVKKYIAEIIAEDVRFLESVSKEN